MRKKRNLGLVVVGILWLLVVAVESSQPSKHYRNQPNVIFKRFSPIEIDENAPIGQLIIDLKVISNFIEISGQTI